MSAVEAGERYVRDAGAVYVFAGMNRADMNATDSERALSIERVHRLAMDVDKRGPHGRRRIVGHSGYWATLAPDAVEFIANNALMMSNLITGVIPSWTSTVLEPRLPGGIRMTSADGQPIVRELLVGRDVRESHLKIAVVHRGVR